MRKTVSEKMSKLKAYLELATDKTATTVAKELKDKDDNIEELIEKLRLMISGKLKIYFKYSS